MILLHLILSNVPGLPDDNLLEDFEKSLEIFSSIEDIIVARRCAEMLREVFEVARACLARRRGDSSPGQNTIHSKTQPRSGNQGLQPLDAPLSIFWICSWIGVIEYSLRIRLDEHQFNISSESCKCITFYI